MDVRWITAFIDRGADGFAEVETFWCAATGSSSSSRRGEHGEFSTLLPHDGSDAHLRVQRTASGSCGSHIDLHVPDVRAGAEQSVAAGASVLADHGGYVVLRTPGGMPFCVVAHHGERRRQGPVAAGGARSATLLDQVSIDADREVFDEEVRFWSAVTGWPPAGTRSSEFVALERQADMPLRVLLQQRGEPSGPTACHLDFACEDVPAAVERHTSLGASVVATHHYWTVMADPSGTEYCLTARLPTTGLLAPE